MTPQEIAQFRHWSPALREALKLHRETVWPFLREQVHVRFGYYPLFLQPCEQCGKTVCPTVQSPYNAPASGWCIECVLDAFFSDAPLYISPEEEARQDNAVICVVPCDENGEPIVWE